jgi:excisionase family DNA binding protein
MGEKLLNVLTEEESRDSYTPLDYNKLWDRHEACRYLGIGKSTLYLLVNRNEIPHFYPAKNKLRFVPKLLEAWATKQASKNQK